jgi:hypothetical protein
MKNLTKLAIASALAVSFVTPVLAQGRPGAQIESSTLAERNVYYFGADGKMHRMYVNDETQAMIMKEFKPIAGTMIFVSGGKLFMAQDTKMADGKMMSTAIYGRDVTSDSSR